MPGIRQGSGKGTRKQMAEELSANKERPTEACGSKASTDNICTIAGKAGQ